METPEAKIIKNLCDNCKNYFDYKSINIKKAVKENEKDEETSNEFSSCLIYGNGFQIKSYYSKNFTQSCSQFDKKRTF